jgi:hypothetical protein
VSGGAAEVHPAGAVLDEHQHVPPCQQDLVEVEEVDGEDPGGLGVQELPPGGAVAAWREIDARGSRDLVDGRRRDGHVELGQLAVDPPVSQSEAGDALEHWGRGLRRLLVSYFLAASLRCQASNVGGVTGRSPPSDCALRTTSAW